MFQRILVAHDDTESAHGALDRTAALARAFDSTASVNSTATEPA
jgi:hypothetical protein